MAQAREERIRHRRERQQVWMRAIFGKPVTAWIALAFFTVGNSMMLLRSITGTSASGSALTVILLPAVALSQSGILLWMSLYPFRAPFRAGVAAVTVIGIPGFWFAVRALPAQDVLADSRYLWVMGVASIAACLVAVFYRMPRVRSTQNLMPLIP